MLALSIWLAVAAANPEEPEGAPVEASEEEREPLEAITFEAVRPTAPGHFDGRTEVDVLPERDQARRVFSSAQAAVAAQLFFGLFGPVSGSVSLPVTFHVGGESKLGIGDVGVGFKVRLVDLGSVVFVLLGDARLPTHSNSDEARVTELNAAVGAVGRSGRWTVQGSAGASTEWGSWRTAGRADISIGCELWHTFALMLEATSAVSAEGVSAAFAPGLKWAFARHSFVALAVAVGVTAETAPLRGVLQVQHTF
ncbi:MAG: hypothetical protein IPJ65_18430 [Archangiaceae bacterium]|nr:hypothetical protein [Archangiaceae bacterium]